MESRESRLHGQAEIAYQNQVLQQTGIKGEQ